MKEFYWKCTRCGVAQPASLYELCDTCYASENREAKLGEAVDHPKHYNQIKGVECIDVVEQMNFNLGNSLKYIWRCEDKGNKIQDIEKAIWYLQREIERTNKQNNQ
jgi:hypothetical protein